MGHAIQTKTTTPWGTARVVEKLTLKQHAGDKRFESVVELLETERGEQLIRIAYATSGTNRRGPVTLRARDLERLRAGLARSPGLGDFLGLDGDA